MATIVTITPGMLVSLASVVHAASTDEITPVITAIQLTRVGNDITAVATDRYRVARATLALNVNEAQSADFTATIAGKAFDTIARAVARAAGRTGRDHASVTLTYTDDDNTGVSGTPRLTITSDFGGAIATVPMIRGNYPPVARLFPSQDELTGECAAVNLNPAFLATIVKLTLPKLDKHAAWTMERQPDSDSNKPRPVLFHVTDDAGDRMEYLVQPNVKLR